MPEQVIVSDHPADEERDEIVPNRPEADSDDEVTERGKSGWNPFPKKIKRDEVERKPVEQEVLPLGDKPRRGRPPGSKNKTSRPSVSSGTRKKELDQMFAMMGVMITPFNAYDGAVILRNGSQLSGSLCKLAEEDARVARMLDGLLTASTWSAVLTGFAAVGVPIMANHRMAPENLATVFGCPTPTDFTEKRLKELGDLGIGS